MIDLFVILFLAAALLNIRPRKKSEIENYISVSQTADMEGLLIYSVFLIHLSYCAISGKLLHTFVLLDDPLVGVFFFYSGFGLLTRYQTSGRAYADSLLPNKFRKLMIPWAVCAVLYTIAHLALGMGSTACPVEGNLPQNILEYLGEWVANGWFIFDFLFFYVFFYLSARLSRGNIPLLIVFNSLLIVAYMAVMRLMGMGAWWYNRSLSFILGLLWCRWRPQIDRILEKHAGKLFLAATAALILLFYIRYNVFWHAYYLVILVFSVWIQLFCALFEMDNVVLRWLHKYQLSFYLIHGLTLGVLRGNLFYIRDDFLFAVLSLISALLGAVALNFATDRLNQLLDRK